MFMKLILILLHLYASLSFIFLNQPIKTKALLCINGCNERSLYAGYLLALRKSRRLLNNGTNTQVFHYININNTEAGVKNIIMENLVLDVSNVQYIHISTKKDRIIIELDKKQKNILTTINNFDTYLNTISLLAKILNIN